jgi:NADH:ubiquinone oxidoreductase subunit 5 (subunit L)/multisubunit Na+/H+ antiporter MnhA subunit
MTRSRSPRNAPIYVTAALVVLAIALIIVGIVYLTDTAAQLPSFFPGHKAGAKRHHDKHGILAIVLAVIALVGAWLSAGRKRTYR